MPPARPPALGRPALSPVDSFRRAALKRYASEVAVYFERHCTVVQATFAIPKKGAALERG